MKRKLSLFGIFAPALLALGLVGCSTEDGPSSTSAISPLEPAGGRLAQKATSDIVDTAIGAGQFGTLVAAVQAAGLEDDLRSPGPFTVFAPDEAAFARLAPGLVAELLKPENKPKLVEILLYHVVAGRVTSGDLRLVQNVATLEGDKVQIRRRLIGNRITVNESQVTTADVFASNGVIHIIDKVLIPPGFTLTGPSLDLVDTAVGAGSFKTLVTAVQAAGLEAAIRGPGQLTVFAPSDEAFARLPPQLLAELLKPKNQAKLQQLLLYHVVSGRVLSTDLKVWQQVGTLADRNVIVRRSLLNGSVTVNLSKVTTANVLATNGVIHVIDRVLVPPGFLSGLLADNH